MKTGKMVSKVMTMIMALVMFGVFTPVEVRASDIFAVAIEPVVQVAPGVYEAVADVTFELVRNGEVLNTDTAYFSVVNFLVSFNLNELHEITLDFVNDGEWVSQVQSKPLSELPRSSGIIQYHWVLTPASQQAVTPPVQPPNANTIVYTIDSINYTNGTLDAAPFITPQGITMVPARSIVEGLGSNDVGFNPDTQAVTFSLNGQYFNLVIGQQLTDSERTPMGAPEIVNGRTFVPVRWVSQTLGANVEWNGTDRTVTITK